jgi:PAS domain-containing protein
LNHKAGNSKHFSITGTILRRNDEGKPALLLFVAEDVSDVHEARLKAEAVKQLMDDTEELLEFGTWSWDAKSGATEMTDGMYRLLEYEKEDMDNSKNHFRLHISPTDQEIIAEKVRKAIQEKSEFNTPAGLLLCGRRKKLYLQKAKLSSMPTDN